MNTAYQETNLIFVMDKNTDYKGETDADGFLPDERSLPAVFRLQICGDPIGGNTPNCRVTRNMKTSLWEMDKNDERINSNKRILYDDVYSTGCVYTANDPTVAEDESGWKSIVTHQTYGDTSWWPGKTTASQTWARTVASEHKSCIRDITFSTTKAKDTRRDI